MRELTSGPWQLKQVRDMMGRMSRLKLTGPDSGAALDAADLDSGEDADVRHA